MNTHTKPPWWPADRSASLRLSAERGRTHPAKGGLKMRLLSRGATATRRPERSAHNDAVVGNLSGMHPGAFLSPQNAGAPRQGAPASSNRTMRHDMHRSRLCALLIDCNISDVDEAARFWAKVLGRPVDLNHWGSRGNYRIGDPAGRTRCAISARRSREPRAFGYRDRRYPCRSCAP